MLEQSSEEQNSLNSYFDNETPNGPTKRVKHTRINLILIQFKNPIEDIEENFAPIPCPSNFFFQETLLQKTKASKHSCLKKLPIREKIELFLDCEYTTCSPHKTELLFLDQSNKVNYLPICTKHHVLTSVVVEAYFKRGSDCNLHRGVHWSTEFVLGNKTFFFDFGVC